MFKKSGYIIIVLTLLFATTGLTINRHYCGKQLMQTSLYSTPHGCCGESCKGCHNEIIKLRITDNFQSSNSRIDYSEGFKTVLKDHALPLILAYSIAPFTDLVKNPPGDYSIKVPPNLPLQAGRITSFLQVFLI